MTKRVVSEETKRKISNTMKARKIQPCDVARESAAEARKAKGNTSEHRQKISKQLKGRKHTKQQREANRRGQIRYNRELIDQGLKHHNKGRKGPGYNITKRTRDKLSKAGKNITLERHAALIELNDNRVWTDTQRRSVSNKMQGNSNAAGMEHTEEFKEWWSGDQMGVNNTNHRPTNIYCAKSGKLLHYNINLTQWCRENDIGRSGLSKTLDGSTHSYKGFYARRIADL